jgi:hypothetical protein
MNELIKFFLSVTVISASVIYIAKRIVDKTLDAAIEKYKSGLDKELEEFKSQLNRINTEHQIKYSRLHEERAEKVKFLHDTLYESEKRLQYITSTFQGSEWSEDDSREKAVKSKLDELNDALELNRIYFSEELCIKIEHIISESWSIVKKMRIAKNKDKHDQHFIKQGQSYMVTNPNEYLELWNEAESFVNNEMKAARMDLVDEFRQLIGVS